jgi:hypothetical protein
MLRVGLNLSDIIVGQGGDLYGDGINIAVRLEGIADPGRNPSFRKVYSEVEGFSPHNVSRVWGQYGRGVRGYPILSVRWQGRPKDCSASSSNPILAQFSRTLSRVASRERFFWPGVGSRPPASSEPDGRAGRDQATKAYRT